MRLNEEGQVRIAGLDLLGLFSLRALVVVTQLVLVAQPIQHAPLVLPTAKTNIVGSLTLLQRLLSETPHHHIFSKTLYPVLLVYYSSIVREAHKTGTRVVGFDGCSNGPVDSLRRGILLTAQQGLSLKLSHKSMLQVLGDVLGVGVAGVVG